LTSDDYDLYIYIYIYTDREIFNCILRRKFAIIKIKFNKKLIKNLIKNNNRYI